MPLLFIMLLGFVWGAAIWDFYQRRIPNPLVLAGVATAIALQFLMHDAAGFLSAIYGMVVGMVILLPGYLLGFTGAGDVKLMGAVGSFLGPMAAFQAAIASVLAGSLVALVYLGLAAFFSGKCSPSGRYRLMMKTLSITGRPVYIAPEEGDVMGKKFPFAISIALGTTAWLIWQWVD